MSPGKPTILVVDDDNDIREMIALTLVRHGYQVLEAEDGQQGFTQAIDGQPDLIIIDWMMPSVNGIELLRRLRRDERTRALPAIMLSAKTEVDNKAQGLDSGADDYLAKPFSPKELLARIRAILRRSTPPTASAEQLRCGELLLDSASHQVSIAGKPIALGPTEYKILQFFMQHPERVYSREQLLDKVWGSTVYIDERTVDVHIRRLRKALEPGNHDALIQTVRSAGYRLAAKTVMEKS